MLRWLLRNYVPKAEHDATIAAKDAALAESARLLNDSAKLLLVVREDLAKRGRDAEADYLLRAVSDRKRLS